MPNVAEIAAMLFDKSRHFNLDEPARFLRSYAPMKTTIRLIITILPFLCLLAARPQAQAVVPPPDGGYPGGNTAEGQNALLSLTTGGFNTAVGFFSLRNDTTGSFNTAVGAGTLLANTADQNTATGVAALLSNTTGTENTAIGTVALLDNTSGSENTAIGVGALLTNTSGDFNTATGFDALFSNITGQSNTADGFAALDFNTVGNGNTAIGTSALQGNTEGDNNTGVGLLALGANTTGNNNTVLGSNSGSNITSADNVICIGSNVAGDNVSNTCYIGNIFGVTSVNGIGVLVNSDGKLGTTTSSRRFKEEIKPMEQASEVLFALKPVSFRYKKEIDPAGTSQLGLVAEDVEKVNPDLVVHDKEDKPYSVRYDQVNAMLLNEFLKEHRKVEKLEATVADLAAQLQKVSAQVQMNNSAAASDRK
jgi:Chaperone of endosialidase